MAIAKKLAVLFTLIVMAGAVVSAQEQAPQTPQAPVNSVQPQVQSDSQGSSTPAGTPMAVDSTTYEIGARDVIRVEVWRVPEFTGTHVVRPDGRITLPLIGDLQAGGLTPARLAAQIKQALGDLYENPDVTIPVLQVNSKMYTVAGLVLRPGAYPMPTPIRVFDALNLAGGFQQWANQKEIMIIREGGDRFKFNYKDFAEKGKNLDANIYLQNGDTILVRE